MIELASPDEQLARFPEAAPPVVALGIGAFVTLPLKIDSRAIGTLSFAYAHPRTLAADERDFILAIASLTAQALERARLYVMERERANVAEALALSKQARERAAE